MRLHGHERACDGVDAVSTRQRFACAEALFRLLRLRGRRLCPRGRATGATGPRGPLQGLEQEVAAMKKQNGLFQATSLLQCAAHGIPLLVFSGLRFEGEECHDGGPAERVWRSIPIAPIDLIPPLCQNETRRRPEEAGGGDTGGKRKERLDLRLRLRAASERLRASQEVKEHLGQDLGHFEARTEWSRHGRRRTLQAMLLELHAVSSVRGPENADLGCCMQWLQWLQQRFTPRWNSCS